MANATGNNSKPPLTIDKDDTLGALDRRLGSSPREGEREHEEAAREVGVPGWLFIAALFAGWFLLAASFWFFVVVPTIGC